MKHSHTTAMSNDEKYETKLSIASFRARLGALIVDFMIVIGFMTLFVHTLFLQIFILTNRLIVFAIPVVILFVCFILRDCVKGQSLGKFVFGIAVRKRVNLSNIVFSESGNARLEIPSVGRIFLKNISWNGFAGTEVYRIQRRGKFVVLVPILASIGTGILLPMVLVFLMPTRLSLSAEEFTFRMERVGFEVMDLSLESEVQDIVDGGVIWILHAESSQMEMEFWGFSTVGDAQRKFFANSQRLDRNLVGGASHSRINMSNFNRHTARRSGRCYTVISRVDNTYIFVSSREENRKAVNHILSELGY